VGSVRRSVGWLLLLALVFSGCARQAPQVSPAPSAAASQAPVLVGATADPTSAVIAELYAQALAARGRQARVVEFEDDVNTLVSRLQAGEADVAPAFAWTAAQDLQVDSEEPDALVSDLAAALDGEVAVLQPSKVDRAWSYVTTGTATSLDAMPNDSTLVGNTRWKSAPDGPEGLAAIYRAKPAVTVVDDADDRLAKVKAGAIGAFDGTEPQGMDGSLTVLQDPRAMIAADPQLALMRLDMSSDEVVLEVIQQLHAVLDNAVVVGIRQRAATLGVQAAVTEWLAEHPLG